MLSHRTLATVRTHAQLVAVLRARADELQITREIGDAAAKPGYSRKLFSRRTPIKNLGLASSLGALLGVLGLALVVVEDARPVELPKRKYRRQGKPDAAGLDVAGHRLDRGAAVVTREAEEEWNSRKHHAGA